MQGASVSVMSTSFKKSSSNHSEKSVSLLEQQAKINEVKGLLGPLPAKLATYSSEDSVARYLRARNWNAKKAAKMLKETLKWRVRYKPEDIRWEEIAREAETGKIYRSDCIDKYGRSVLVMRPSCQNTKSTKGQIRYLVYCMENAIFNLSPDQEQMVWLIDFSGFNLSHISVKVTRETAHVLQEHYPERLGSAILYNPPKFFEPFWKLVKPFLETKTCNKVKFVYSDDPNSMKVMEEHFDMDQLETAFGGKNQSGFNINRYAEKMREDDHRRLASRQQDNTPSSTPQLSKISLGTLNPNSESDASDSEKTYGPLMNGLDSDVSGDESASVTDIPRTQAPEVLPATASTKLEA